MEFLKALQDRARRAAQKAVRAAAFWAPLTAALLGGALPARAGTSAALDIDVTIQGIGAVTDLAATPGTSTGSINLSWTEPHHFSGTAPFTYDVRASSVAQINNTADFTAAASLSTFSPSSPPTPGSGGGAAGFVVDGLQQGVTYYFAIRENDSGGLHGVWLRSATINVDNFAVATSTRPPPPASGAVTAVGLTSATAAWAPAAGATDYLLIAATDAGLTSVAASSSTVLTTATVSGLSPNTTYWLAASACGDGCSAYAAVGSTVTLAASAVSLSTTAVSSTTVDLAWGAGGNPSGTLYRVLSSTDGVAYSPAASATIPSASVVGLTGGGTYYFEVVAVNAAGLAAAASPPLSVVTPTGPVPSTPTGFAAAAGLLRVALSWNPLPAAQQGTGLLDYELQRSTNAGFGYVALATTTASTYVDLPLTAGTTYYYRLAARALDGAGSALTAAVSAVPYTQRPMSPLGLTVAASSTTVSISWSKTTRFESGAPFLSTGTPAADELQGYELLRSTDICNVNYVLLSTYSVTTTAVTDATGGLNYYYHLLSFNSLGVSTNVVTFSSLGERSYFVDDCLSAMVLDDGTADQLNGSANGAGDIRLTARRRPQDVGDGIYQSVEFSADRDGSPLPAGYALSKNARVVLHYVVGSAGAPTPDSATVQGLSGPAAASAADLGVYWFNGQAYQKMYGRVDALSQTVTVQSPNLGVYQIRAQARTTSGPVFDVSNLSGRVITPNGDGRNDVAIFTYDPGPENVVPAGRVYDLRGAYVADMTPGLVANTLTWDGKMNGTPVHSGVYVYRITGGGKTFTGTIVVAR
ncbi:MAG: hypothetical protein KGM24_00090 [Elusimicrobia bacterium]|nr:hypothetical protein [Elusimicrobiota bacterium]